MEFSPALVYDAVAALIIVICAAAGANKGFVKMMVMFLGYIICFAAALFISRSAAPMLYDSYLKEPITTAVEKEITEASETIKEKIRSIIAEYGYNADNSEIDDFIDRVNSTENGDIADEILKYIPENSKTGLTKEEINAKLKELTDIVVPRILPSADEDMGDKLLRSVLGEPSEAAAYIEENFIKYEAVYLLRSLLFFVIFGAAMTIVRRLSRASSAVKKIPLVGTANTVLGGAAGLIEAGLYIALITALLRIIIGLSGNIIPFVNTETIDNTVFYRYIYYFSLS